jgi:hypothetical protein
MIVIADTTPLNYLVLIHQSHLLPQLYGLEVGLSGYFQNLGVALDE